MEFIMTKLKCILLLLLMSIIVLSCKTTDPADETSTEEVTTDEALEVEQSDITETNDQAIEPLDEELLANAKKLIFKAEEARAATYFPGRLKDIKNLLNEVYAIKDTDPDKARELLAQIEEDATNLTADSWEALKLACIKILESKTAELLKISADKYAPEQFGTSQEQKNVTIQTFEANDFTGALGHYRVAYTSLTNLHNTLSKNLKNIDDLNRFSAKYFAEAEELNSNKWAPEELQAALESNEAAKKLIYTDYNIVEGEKVLRDTLFLVRKAVKQTKINIAVAETDEDIFSLMGELEDASTLTVVDEDDNIISPEEWKGEANLIEKPIEAVIEEQEESVIEEIDLEKEVEVDFPEVSFNIIPGETKVLGDMKSRSNLLEEAKKLWALGIEARNNGELEVAQEYLAKAKVYIDEYKSMAVENVYTVILNPARRDCLWRIAEKKEFYDDPFKWQLIWERNKKLIQDPDLIYPGWKLIIPPLD